MIQDLIDRGKLPRAPISSDVRQLNMDWLRKHAGNTRPQLIVGGFPCVGFSAFGLRQGFGEAQSRMFYHILRIADGTACPALFLENVPPILGMGMREIAYQLAHLRGYEVRWCLVSARMMGAAHKRMRWYCLAVKPDFSIHLARSVKYEEYCWTKRNMPLRAVAQKTTSTVARLKLMGNSVVPDAVRYAFLFLASRGAQAQAPVRSLSTAAGWALIQAPEIAAQLLASKARQPPRMAAWPPCGIYLSCGKMLKPPRPAPYRAELDLDLEFDARLYRPAKGHKYSALKRYPSLRRRVYAKCWATPRHNMTGASAAITRRTKGDLPTQVRFERSTPNHLRPGGAVNPVFVEWLMGYPEGWTRAAED